MKKYHFKVTFNRDPFMNVKCVFFFMQNFVNRCVSGKTFCINLDFFIDTNLLERVF